ncbi:MAG: DUF350 domain-containing protein [Pirellulaceae bacterium]|nr:DUF350 domain-containing protein [Pirellulaceae bacterium]
MGVWIGMGLAAIYGLIGIILSVVGYFLFDLVEWRIDFADEIKKGNMAAAIVMAAFILGICLIVGRAIGS